MGLLRLVWALYSWFAFFTGWLLAPAVLVALIIVAIDRLLLRKPVATPEKGKHAIMITGADSGLGLETAHALSQAGYRVFAGTFLPSGADAVKAKCGSDLVHPVPIDVLSTESCIAAAAEVEKLCATHNCSLFGLHNNAGGAFSGPLVCVPEDKLLWQFELNSFGQVRATKAFLPLLMRTALASPNGGARIVNTISVAGRVSGRNFGPYSGSKHAMEAFTDALRQELVPFGITVIGVEPSFVQTPLVKGVPTVAVSNWNACVNRDLYPKQAETISQDGGKIYDHMSLPITAIRAPLVSAFTDPKPAPRYTLSKPPNPIYFTVLPSSVSDLLASMFTPSENGASRESGRKWLSVVDAKSKSD